jgi:hypothetical protein
VSDAVLTLPQCYKTLLRLRISDFQLYNCFLDGCLFVRGRHGSQELSRRALDAVDAPAVLFVWHRSNSSKRGFEGPPVVAHFGAEGGSRLYMWSSWQCLPGRTI